MVRSDAAHLEPCGRISLDAFVLWPTLRDTLLRSSSMRIGERSDAVLRTAMAPQDEAEFAETLTSDAVVWLHGFRFAVQVRALPIDPEPRGDAAGFPLIALVLARHALPGGLLHRLRLSRRRL